MTENLVKYLPLALRVGMSSKPIPHEAVQIPVKHAEIKSLPKDWLRSIGKLR